MTLDKDLITAARTLLDRVEYDCNGTMGKGGNGGLLNSATIHAAGQLRIALDRHENAAPSSVVMTLETAKAISLGASVLARIEDPDARKIAIRNALTAAALASPQDSEPGEHREVLDAIQCHNSGEEE